MAKRAKREETRIKCLRKRLTSSHIKWLQRQIKWLQRKENTSRSSEQGQSLRKKKPQPNQFQKGKQEEKERKPSVVRV